MGALAGDRNTPRREGDIYVYPVKASTKIYGGSMVALDASGYAVPASDAAGLVIRGVSEEYVDNSAGGNAAKTVSVRRGVYQFAGSGLTIADIGKPVFASDDQTVSVAATTNSIVAGVLVDIDGASKAWVDFRRHPAKAVASVTQADAPAQSGAYVQADVESIRALANANKVAINAVLAALRANKIMAT